MGNVPDMRQDPDPRARRPCRGSTAVRAPAAGRGKYPTTCPDIRERLTKTVHYFVDTLVEQVRQWAESKKKKNRNTIEIKG